MPQTFYTTQDEEILSIVGRLRASELLENVFVIPKRALVLQSIVNLRMLAREAERSGKQVVIVTQDENGRRLADKAGLTTRPYSEEASRDPEPVIREIPIDAPIHRHPIHFSDSIGSSGFYENEKTHSNGTDNIKRNISTGMTTNELRLKVRNTSPIRQTSLNSMRAKVEIGPESHSTSQHTPNQTASQSHQSASDNTHQQERAVSKAGKLTRVFSPSNTTERHSPEATRAMPGIETHTYVGGKGTSWFSFFVAISILFLFGTGAFIFLPKAEISVIPMSISQDIGMEFEGKIGSSAADERIIPIRMVEKEQTITITGEATGSANGNGSKASGKILIYNEYGTNSQPLVATTRFQSKDGKIFRLAKGVTVPGASDRNGKREPGVVEADVVADAAGNDYNIASTDFSIPGFSGSAKVGKIYAKSKSPMSGGSSIGQSGVVSVSSADLEKAKGDALQKFRDLLSEILGKDLAADERFITETVDIAPVGNPIAPGIGSAASSFEYTVALHAKCFVFSESELKNHAVEILRKKASIDEMFSTRDITFHYEGGTADYQAGTFRFKTNVNALFVAAVDTGSLRDDFLGKKDSEIKPILEKHPEVKNIEIELKPKGFSFAVPKDRKRVSITIVQP